MKLNKIDIKRYNMGPWGPRAGPMGSQGVDQWDPMGGTNGIPWGGPMGRGAVARCRHRKSLQIHLI